MLYRVDCHHGVKEARWNDATRCQLYQLKTAKLLYAIDVDFKMIN